MTISVFNRKGGVGKSAISINLTLELGYDLIDNDPYGGVVDLLNYKKHKKRGFTINKNNEDIPFRRDTIYDFSSCEDNRTIKIIERSDIVIVPTLHSHQDIRATVLTILDIKNKNIIVVINKVDTRSMKKQGGRVWYKDFEDTKKNIENLLPKKKIIFLSIKDNKAWLNSVAKARSIKQLAKDSNLVKHNSLAAIADLDLLLNTIRDIDV